MEEQQQRWEDIAFQINKGELLVQNIDMPSVYNGILQFAFNSRDNNKRFPLFFWIYANITFLTNIDNRIYVLQQFVELTNLLRSKAYTKEQRDEGMSLYYDLESLIYIQYRVKNHILKYGPVPRHKVLTEDNKWDEVLLCMDELYFLLDHMDVQFLSNLCQATIGYASQIKETSNPWVAFARLKHFSDKLYVADICQYLYGLFVAYGLKDYLKCPKGAIDWIPSVSDFPVELRNECFDLYISLRLEQMRNEPIDNNRAELPTDKDYLIQMLEKETQAIESFSLYAELPAVDVPISEDVIDAAHWFLEHLQKKIDHTEGNIITLCNFDFLAHKNAPNASYTSRWLWHDEDNYITVNWQEMQRIIAYLPTTDLIKPRKWLRQYLKDHPSVNLVDSDEIFVEIEAIAMQYIEDFFRFNKESRIFNIDYDQFVNMSEQEVSKLLGLPLWKESFEKYSKTAPTIHIDQQNNTNCQQFAHVDNPTFQK